MTTRRHKGLPKANPISICKSVLLSDLSTIDMARDATQRVLAMETDFRTRIENHVNSLPAEDAVFSKFNTNPFVLMFHSMRKHYRHIGEIENDILPAKVFSSMETSAGRMVETIVLPVYGWETVPSEMHTPNSALDGRVKKGDTLYLATLKSGPRCLNDEMSENLADAILQNYEHWAMDAGVQKIDFTYGVLYGTQKQSNKKDWHILRNIEEKLHGGRMILSPNKRWNLEFEKSGIDVSVSIRIGVDLWNFFGGGAQTFVEMASAVIRACIAPSDTQPVNHQFTIADLPQIISLDTVPPRFNVSLLQRSQLEWLFFFARHFCDSIE
jgi:hypothetical protein